MYDPYSNREEDNQPSGDASSFHNKQNEGTGGDQNQAGETSGRSETEQTLQQANKPPYVPSEMYYGRQNYSQPEYGEPRQYAPYQTYPPYGQPPHDAQKKPGRKHLWLKVVALVLCVAIIGTAAGVVSYYSLKNADDNSQLSVKDDDSQASTPGVDDAQSGKGDSDGPNSVVSGKTLTTYTGSGESLTPTEIYNNYVSACVGIATEITGTNIFGQLTTTPVSGSGFIISPDGYILTNAHVVSEGSEFEVSLYDGSTHSATLVGMDTTGDVALLKIDVDYELNYVVLGDIDDCQVGEEVSVIGNPLGELTFTLTTGHISALDRNINIDGTYQNMFQIDAAINSGNSGGPVFNSRGEVIGVATAKYSSTGVEGLAFALPIDDVVEIANDLSQYGYVKGRAYMGIYYYDVDSQYAYYYSVPTGVYVDSTVEGGCAQKAGIQHADIITAIDGVDVVSGAQLKSEIAKHVAGDTVTLSVYREGQTLEVSVTFDEYVPGSTSAPTNSSGVQGGSDSSSGSSFFNPFN